MITKRKEAEAIVICHGQERLWVFDFDGALARSAPDRKAVELHRDGGMLLEDLAAQPRQRVAVISSRSLDDLIALVPVPGIYLGGASGIEWQFPDGSRSVADGEREQRLTEKRAALMDGLVSISALPGVEMEDNKWSVALNTSRLSPDQKVELFSRMVSWHVPDSVRIFSGRDVLEIQFLPEIDKEFGVRKLCQMLKFAPSGGNILYAGEDESDAFAMRWVLKAGGVAYMVGGFFNVAGARIVMNTVALASEVRKMAGIK